MMEMQHRAMIGVAEDFDDKIYNNNAVSGHLVPEGVKGSEVLSSLKRYKMSNVTQDHRQHTDTLLRGTRKPSETGESVKNVSFKLDEISKRKSLCDVPRRESVKYSHIQPRPETRRSSAHAVLVRHRKLSRQLSSADWAEMTRDSVLRRFSDADSDIWARKSGKFSTFVSTNSFK